MDPSDKFHNASDKYPTMHHFVTEMCTHVHISVTKWCIVGNIYLFCQKSKNQHSVFRWWFCCSIKWCYVKRVLGMTFLLLGLSPLTVIATIGTLLLASIISCKIFRASAVCSIILYIIHQDWFCTVMDSGHKHHTARDDSRKRFNHVSGKWHLIV